MQREVPPPPLDGTWPLVHRDVLGEAVEGRRLTVLSYVSILGSNSLRSLRSPLIFLLRGARSLWSALAREADKPNSTLRTTPHSRQTSRVLLQILEGNQLVREALVVATARFTSAMSVGFD